MAIWKQTRYNQWTLLVGSRVLRFATYKEMYDFCQKHGINATPA